MSDGVQLKSPKASSTYLRRVTSKEKEITLRKIFKIKIASLTYRGQ